MMVVYLYTENFETSIYRLYRWNGGRLCCLCGDDNERYLKIAAGVECGDVSESGVGVSGISGIRFCLSFSVQINEVSPSGRRRLLFGFTEPSFSTRVDFTDLKNAILEFCVKNNMSIPKDRLETLIGALNAKRNVIVRESFRRYACIALAALTLGISILVSLVNR